LPIVIPVLVCHAPGGFTAPSGMQALAQLLRYV
jgi:hypothetical protein